MDGQEQQEKPLATIAYATPSVRLFHPLAIVSLILGLLFFLPIIAAVGAIVVGWIARKRLENRPEYRGRGMALAGMILGMISIVGFFVSIPLLLRAHHQRQQIQCMTHLRQIAMATFMYANDYRGAFPPNPAALNVYIGNPGVWICPEGQQPVPGGGVANSYIYLGAKLGPTMRRVRAPGTTILAYEPLNNHDGRGFCAVFLDGHVEWITADKAPAVMQQIQQLVGN